MENSLQILCKNNKKKVLHRIFYSKKFEEFKIQTTTKTTWCFLNLVKLSALCGQIQLRKYFNVQFNNSFTNEPSFTTFPVDNTASI